MKWASFAIKIGLAVGVLGLAALELGHFQIARLSAKVDALEQEKKELLNFVDRLQASRRVAQVDIVKQYQDPLGRTVTVLLWQEIGTDGVLGRPFALEAVGTQIYFEGWIIKFDHERLRSDEPEKGASLVWFRRIFGDKQTPDSAIELDRTLGPPSLSSTPDDEKRKLWERFWELTEHPVLARQMGVRVAQSEAPSVRVQPGQIWEVSLETAGGLNVRILGKRAEQAASDVPG